MTYQNSISRRGVLRAFGGLALAIAGCAVNKNTLDITEDSREFRDLSYTVDEIEINGKRYMALPFPRGMTAQIDRDDPKNPGAILDRRVLADSYLVDYDNSTERLTRRNGEKMRIIQGLSYVLANISCQGNQKFINSSSTPQRTRTVLESIQVPPNKGDKRGEVLVKRTEGEITRKYPTIQFNGKNFYIAQANPDIVAYLKGNPLSNEEFLKFLLLDGFSEPVTKTIRRTDDRVTKVTREFSLEGFQYMPIRARLIPIQAESIEEKRSESILPEEGTYHWPKTN